MLEPQPQNFMEEFMFMITDIMEAEGVTDFQIDEIMQRGMAIEEKYGSMQAALTAIPHRRHCE